MTKDVSEQDGECHYWKFRFHPEGRGQGRRQEGQPAFTKRLAELVAMYMSMTPLAPHTRRGIASTALIAGFDSDHKMFGYLMGKEVAAVEGV